MRQLSDLLFGDSTTHPLELDKKEHRDKQVELDHKREQLSAKRDELQDRVDELKSEYIDARDRGDEDAAERALREAERAEEQLETVNGKLDIVDQMSQTVSNFLNVYEMRELRDDQYWERLMELDREELVEMFSQEKLTIEQMTERLDTVGIAASDVVSVFSESTDRLHGNSELRDKWDEEYQNRKESNTSTPDPEDVFGDIDSSVDDDDLSDLQLS